MENKIIDLDKIVRIKTYSQQKDDNFHYEKPKAKSWYRKGREECFYYENWCRSWEYVGKTPKDINKFIKNKGYNRIYNTETKQLLTPYKIILEYVNGNEDCLFYYNINTWNTDIIYFSNQLNKKYTILNDYNE